MSTEWITDRRPTKDDADEYGYGLVWATYDGRVVPWSYDGVAEGTPWMPIVAPASYVKPKRWRAEYRQGSGCWVITDNRPNLSAIGTLLTVNNDEHREAAEEIAAIYERTMP